MASYSGFVIYPASHENIVDALLILVLLRCRSAFLDPTTSVADTQNRIRPCPVNSISVDRGVKNLNWYTP